MIDDPIDLSDIGKQIDLSDVGNRKKYTGKLPKLGYRDSGTVAKLIAPNLMAPGANTYGIENIPGVTSLIQGSGDVGVKALQLLAGLPVVPNAATNYVNQLARDRERIYNMAPESESLAGGALRTAGQIAASRLMRLPMPTGMVAQGATMGAMQPVTDEEGNVWSNTLGQAAAGGILGKLSGAAAGYITPAAGKLYNFIKGKIRPEIQSRLTEAAAEGVELKPSQVLTAAKPPAQEIAQAEAAAKRVSSDLGGKVASTDFGNLAEVEAAAKTIGPRANQANELLARIKSLGGEAKDIVNTSLGLKSLQEKLRIDKLFAMRDRLAEGVIVKPTQTIAAIDSALDDVAGLDATKWPNRDAVIAKLQKLKDNLLNTSQTTESKLLQESGMPYTNTVETPNTFKAISRTRSDISSELSDYFKGTNAEIGRKGSNILQAVKNGLESDLEAAAQNSGNAALAKADKIARSEYSKYSGTFRDPAVVAAVTSSEPSKILETIAKAGPEKAKRIYDALDPKGQLAFAKGVWDEALDAAIDQSTGRFVPGKFASSLNARTDALGISVGGSNTGSLKAIKNIMQTLAQSSPEGASAAGAIARGVSASSAKAHLVSNFIKYMQNYGTDTILNSPVGRRFMFAASKLPPGSQKMFDLMETTLPKLVAAGSGRAIGTPSPEGQEE